ncbi:MAG: TAT-variant-translocated molybdopterin oxidoreductase [Flavobacteriales bacterium]
MASNKQYWRGFAELEDNTLIEKLETSNEFPENLPTDEFLGNKEGLDTTKTSRRDFLKFVGFSTAAATLASCEGPVIKSIPYVVKPEDITPGVANYYATTLMNNGDFASVLVKTREGRPIKIEVNDTAKYFGLSSARIQGSVLSLYNSERLKTPFIKGKEASFSEVDKFVTSGLAKAVEAGKQIVILTPSYPSPSFKKLVKDFKVKYPTAKQVIYDAVSDSAAIDAYEEFSGTRALPFYALEKAKLVVSFGADFLGDWNGGGYEKAYASSRKPGKNMARHIQIEANMSITGANADTRFPMKPTNVEKTLAHVYEILTGGNSTDKIASAIAQEIKTAGSNAVVLVEGSKEAHSIGYAINALINSQVVNTSKAVLIKESNDKTFNQFVTDLKARQIGAVLNFNTNIVYSYPEASEIKAALKKVDLTVSFNLLRDETSEVMNVLVPSTHWLESWGDANPVTGSYTLTQPTIRPLFKGIRQFEESLMKWSGIEGTYYDYLKANWDETILAKSSVSKFNKALYEGVIETSDAFVTETSAISVETAVSKLSSIKAGITELSLYTKAGIGNGTEFHNPWMQEFPDPISRTSWDNYVTMSYADAKEHGLLNTHEMNGAMNGSYINLTVGKTKIEKIPVLVQPGQAKGSLGLALGYGQKSPKLAEAIGEKDTIGVNAYPAYKDFNKSQSVSFEKVGGQHGFACIQLQNTLMGRDKIMREVTLADFINEKSEVWNPVETLATHNGKEHVSTIDLWTSFDRSNGHYFNMSIDLSACTGCGSCVVSCTAENNVPVVGKHEIRVSRDMQWLRIDRYYSSESTFKGDAEQSDNFSGLSENLSGYGELEIPQAENPQVAFQPVMCQHCNHAPCETVCPVAATSHGKQGQNQMAYNRCVGTRYCANNCPYKVRRFNWFNYANNDQFDFNMNDDMGRMVLNPDVAVRSRGVMEKCSMCIQMTQATILKAKKEGRAVDVDEFKVACATACPTNAIVFGDINNEKDEVYAKLQDKRQYYLLEHIGTKPNMFYQVKVRNTGKKS